MKVRCNLLFIFITALVSLCFLHSCSVKKHLGPTEYLVTSNEVVLNDKENAVGAKSTMKYELSKLIQQDLNSKLLFFFRPEVKWHYTSKPINQEKINSEKWSTRVAGKFHKWFIKKFTEKPVLHDKAIMDATAKQMQNYMQNRGFFDAKVTSAGTLDDKTKKAKIEYIVDPGKAYKVDSLIYESNDTVITNQIDWLQKDSYFSKGELIDLKLYNQDVKRITDSLRNHGYAYFFPSYIQQLEADSSDSKTNLIVYSKINKPVEEDNHKQYYVGKINVYSNYKGKSADAGLRDTFINGIHYKTSDGDLGIKPTVIRKNIFLNSGDLYRQNLIKKTNTQLGALGVYKFINVIQKKSETSDEHIDFDVFLSKSKKQSVNFQADINNSQRTLARNSSISSLIGAVGNITYKNRNTFKGAEIIGVTLEGGIEFNLQNNDTLINSQDILARVDVQLPEFIDIPGTWKLLSSLKFGKFHLINPVFYKELKEKSKPIGTIAYNLFDLKDFYSYKSLEASWGYDLRRSAREQYRINTIGLTLFRADIKRNFQDRLDQNPFLLKIFEEDQLFTGFLFNSFNYIWTGPKSIFGESWQMRFNQEVSGFEAFIANRIVHKGKKPFDLPNDIKFSHFIKGDFDVRYFKQYNDGNILGIRASTGLAIPYGGDSLSVAVPFVKQFSVGGPNSIRAWRIRELGPGSHFDSTILEPPFYQTGDFKFEFSIEYRFKFIPFFAMDGAVFLDGGNVWTLREDPDRLGSQLRWRSYFKPDNPDPIGGNFISQMALGTGFGLRVDFTYVILRFDVGLKMRSPYKLSSGSNWYFDQWQVDNHKELLNYNLGLGYPF